MIDATKRPNAYRLDASRQNIIKAEILKRFRENIQTQPTESLLHTLSNNSELDEPRQKIIEELVIEKMSHCKIWDLDEGSFLTTFKGLIEKSPHLLEDLLSNETSRR